jgi:hypothetical protein
MSIIEEYTEATVLERSEDDSETNEQPTARVSFGTFILRVAAPSDN